MAYGGDFWRGDKPEDGKFVTDGLVFSDHTPTPGLIEYKRAIEPVQLLGGSASGIEIVNRYDFITLDHLKCTCSILGDGFIQSGGEIQIPAGILPGQTAELSVSALHRTEFTIRVLPSGEFQSQRCNGLGPSWTRDCLGPNSSFIAQGSKEHNPKVDIYAKLDTEFPNNPVHYFCHKHLGH